MRKLTHSIIMTLTLALLAMGCQQNDLDQKKAALKELKRQKKDLTAEIAVLEAEIAELDTSAANRAPNTILVNTQAIRPQQFRHTVEFRGEVSSNKNVLISTEISGKIAKIHVTEGQRVRKGQLLVSLDADIIRNNIGELEKSLELANQVFERQARLWDQNIGTEIQYLEAKNKKESLEKRLATAKAQLDQARITAPFSGNIDNVDAKEGEMAMPGTPLLRIVNPDDLHIQADISERYVGDFRRGDTVVIQFPMQENEVTATIKSVGDVIDPNNRTFSIEVKMPKTSFPVKPNQVVVLKLTDYESDNAYIVPTKLVLSDSEGKYIYVAVPDKEGLVARKRRIEVGKSQEGHIEVLSGLSKGDQVIHEGYRDINDGVAIRTNDDLANTAKL